MRPRTPYAQNTYDALDRRRRPGTRTTRLPLHERRIARIRQSKRPAASGGQRQEIAGRVTAIAFCASMLNGEHSGVARWLWLVFVCTAPIVEATKSAGRSEIGVEKQSRRTRNRGRTILVKSTVEAEDADAVIVRVGHAKTQFRCEDVPRSEFRLRDSKPNDRQI